MEQPSIFGKSNIRYSKISLKVRDLLSLEAVATRSGSSGEESTRFKGSKETRPQAIDCQVNPQKVQGSRNFLRIEGREGKKIGKRW